MMLISKAKKPLPVSELSIGQIAARRRLAKSLRMAAPPPKLLVSEWADRYRILPSETSAEPGRWHTDRAPFQREPMDAVLDPEVEIEVLMWGSQNGKTEIINNLVFYFTDQDPAPIIAVQPTVEAAEAWSKERLAPSIAATPRLRGKISDAKSRDSGNTILSKKYPGGHLAIVGANAPSGLAARPRRFVFGDEIDRWPASAGAEGSPWALAWKRTTTFWNRKGVVTSTPTIKDLSAIETWFLRSDQRYYHVPCPNCWHAQRLRWRDDQEKFNIMWAIDEHGAVIPESVHYLCEKCRFPIEEVEKREMLARGVWIPTFPERKKIRGYHLNTLYSPWKRWYEIVQEWIDVQGKIEELKVFINTILAETWEERGDSFDASDLRNRVEDYDGEVPRGAGVLTAAVDVQGDRLELLVKAWGDKEESWTIAVAQVYGDPAQETVWLELDKYLLNTYDHASGAEMTISSVMVDSGGHHTEHVYRFCKGREMRRIRGIVQYVYPLKGISGAGKEILGRPSKKNRYKVQLFPVGVDTAKDTYFARLRIPTPGPGYYHLPSWIDDEFLEQMTSEKALRKYKKGVGAVREYVKTRERNEGLDLEVYSIAALYRLGRPLLAQLGAKAEELNMFEGGGAPPPSGGAAPPPAAPPPKRWSNYGNAGGSWINGWR